MPTSLLFPSSEICFKLNDSVMRVETVPGDAYFNWDTATPCPLIFWSVPFIFFKKLFRFSGMAVRSHTCGFIHL